MNKKSFIITFGQIHTHRIDGKTIDKDCVVQIDAPNEFLAYEKAKTLFGENWSGIEKKQEYTDEVAEFFPRGIVATFKV